MYDKKTLEMITFIELAGTGLTLMPYVQLPTHQLAKKYELTFKCCCPELFAGSLTSSDRGLTSWNQQKCEKESSVSSSRLPISFKTFADILTSNL